MSDISKTAKIVKRWYYSTAHWQLDNAMVSDITFFPHKGRQLRTDSSTRWPIVLPQNGCTRLESAGLSTLVRCTLSSSADDPQLLIFWQMVQRDSQSNLVTGTSRFIAPWHSIQSKSHRNWSKSYLPMLFSAARGTDDIIGLVPSNSAGVSNSLFCVEL